MELSGELRARYLDLLEKSLGNAIYGESEAEMALRSLLQRLRHPYLTRRGAFAWPARAHSMIGQARLRHLRGLVERTIYEDIPGDYIETGVWRGGASILMRGVLAAHGIRDRRVFCANSSKDCRGPMRRAFRPTGAIVSMPSRNLPCPRKPCAGTSPHTICWTTRWSS